MKILFSIALAIFVFLWVAQIKITFNPLSISFGSLRFALGLVITAIGIGLIGADFYKQGIRDNNKMLNEVLDNWVKEREAK